MSLSVSIVFVIMSVASVVPIMVVSRCRLCSCRLVLWCIVVMLLGSMPVAIDTLTFVAFTRLSLSLIFYLLFGIGLLLYTYCNVIMTLSTLSFTAI